MRGEARWGPDPGLCQQAGSYRVSHIRSDCRGAQFTHDQGQDESETLKMITVDSFQDRVWQIQACSATSGEGVRDGMEWVLKNISKK